MHLAVIVGKTLRRGLALAAWLIGGGVHSMQAQQGPAVSDGLTPQYAYGRGAFTEILGLRHWTIAMLRDSLAVHAPKASLTSGRAHEALKEALRFPEAFWLRYDGDSSSNLLIVVVEPQDSARLVRRRFAGDSARRLAPWGPLADFIHARTDLVKKGLEPAVYQRAAGLLPATMPLNLRFDSTEVRRLWSLLGERATPKDRDDARHLVLTSPHVEDRLTAIAVLSNFERDDLAWHALVGALLDPSDEVGELAWKVLNAFTQHAPRPVDWAPATQDLRAILNGAMLSILPDVLDVLVSTRVSPTLAGPLLHDGGYGVLLYASGTGLPTRVSSYRFLRAMSGGRPYTQPAEWRTWVAGLSE